MPGANKQKPTTVPQSQLYMPTPSGASQCAKATAALLLVAIVFHLAAKHSGNPAADVVAQIPGGVNRCASLAGADLTEFVRTEPILRDLLSKLIVHPTLLHPNGSIIDAGANFGDEACLYAVTSPQRTVHAVEPAAGNVGAIAQRYGSLPNLRRLTGLLGRESGVQLLRRAPGQMEAGAQVTLSDQGRFVSEAHDGRAAMESAARQPGAMPMFALDALYAQQWAGTGPLALGHFDVEGGELELLKGAHEVHACPHALLPCA